MGKSFQRYIESIRTIKDRFANLFNLQKIILNRDIKRRFYEYLEAQKEAALTKSKSKAKKGAKKGDKKGAKKDLKKKLEKMADADLEAAIDKMS